MDTLKLFCDTLFFNSLAQSKHQLCNRNNQFHFFDIACKWPYNSIWAKNKLFFMKLIIFMQFLIFFIRISHIYYFLYSFLLLLWVTGSVAEDYLLPRNRMFETISFRPGKLKNYFGWTRQLERICHLHQRIAKRPSILRPSFRIH